MGGCVAVWLVVLAAIVHLPSGTAQFQTCHDNAAANCGGNVVTGVSTARECCLGDGFWFMVWGQCVQCIVHGFERTVVLVDEGNVQETLVISLDIKGTTTDELPQNRVNQFDLTAICRDVTTERDDYGTTACGSRVELDVNNPAALTSQVLITFPADNNALEGTEELRLELQLPPVTQAAVNFAGNVFFQDVSIQIRDTTVLRSGFGQEVYSGNEGPDRRSTLPNAPCRVTIRLQDTTIEAPLTFRLSPRTPSEIFAANGPWPSPCTAAFKGANASRMDFNTRPFDVTMAAGTEAVLAEIAIVDDEINEAEEYFVVVLEIITSTTNPVEFTIQTAVCRIPRTDPIQIGFTQSRVEHNESQATFEAVLEKDRPSDQTFVIRIRISTPRIQGVGEPATAFPSSPADFGLGNTTVRTVRLTPADNVAVLAYQIFEDNTPEETEMFQLSADPDPDTRDNPDFKCDADAEFQFHGRDCFTDLQVLILDDDVVVVGFVETLVEVDESDGQATLKVSISFPAPNPTLSFVIMFRLDATMTSITAGPRPASSGRFDPVIPGIHDYQEILPAVVLPLEFEGTRRLQTFTVQIFEDGVPEDVEELNITLSLQDPRLASVVTVSPAVATVRIRDSDIVVVGFVETLVEVNESNGQATLKVSISFPVPNPALPFLIMFRLNATMTSITAGPSPASSGPVIPGIHDYQEIDPALVLPLEFEDTRRSQTFNVQIFEDGVPEDVEELNITLSLQDPSLANQVIVTPAVATVRIWDTTVAVVGFVETLVEVYESNGQATLKVSISFPVPNPALPFLIMFRLNATMTSITAGPRPASSGQFNPVIPGIHDYQEIDPALVLPLEFEDTQRLQTFNVQIFEDGVPEDVEELNITLSLQDSRLANQVIVTPAVATVRIWDRLVVGFERSTYRVHESQGSTELCVIVIQPADQNIGDITFTLAVETKDGNATVSGSDYTKYAELLGPFTSQQPRQCFRVNVTDDGIMDLYEIFSVNLTLASVMTIAANRITVNPPAATVIIL